MADGDWRRSKGSRDVGAPPDFGAGLAASLTMKTGGAVGLCALLAACSAHDRSTTAAAPQPAQPVALVAEASVGQGGVPVPQPAPAMVAAAKTTAAQPQKFGRAGGGLASWYGDRFHGRTTANGERFDMATLTAAHRSFPLPSYVRVTNVSNGRSIVVRVNDRGPYHGNRVIDVSKRTADLLGFRGHGVGNVKLDYVGAAPKSGSDDRKLLASFQEFGRPMAPPGVQMASLAPVSDAQLAQEASSGGGAYALASAAYDASSAAISYSASAVASGAKAAVSGARAAASGAGTAVRKVLPSRAEPTPQQVAAAAEPMGVSAYASPQPGLVGAPAAIVDPAKARRVVTPSEPALASAVPSPAGRTMDVSSRIASSFEGFGASATQVTTGGSAAFEGSR